VQIEPGPASRRPEAEEARAGGRWSRRAEARDGDVSCSSRTWRHAVLVEDEEARGGVGVLARRCEQAPWEGSRKLR
jgi:hypothetical protein